MKILAVVAVVFVTSAAVAIASTGGAGFDPSFPDPATWQPVTTWHLAPAPGADYIIKRQIGTADDTTDDTVQVTYTNSNGGTAVTNSSPWETIDATQFGVPATATAVKLTFKAVITGIANSETTVYAFVKTDGSPICSGPPGFENYPVDDDWTGEAGGGGEKCWAVHASIDGSNGVREFDTVDVPLTNGKFDFAWGYRKPPGQWPQGSALAVGGWLDGWAS